MIYKYPHSNITVHGRMDADGTPNALGDFVKLTVNFEGTLPIETLISSCNARAVAEFMPLVVFAFEKLKK